VPGSLLRWRRTEYLCEQRLHRATVSPALARIDKARHGCEPSITGLPAVS